MARMIPPEVRDDTASQAERLMFQQLKTQLPADYTVLHSVSWLSRQSHQSLDGEADFVLLHPDRGFLVLEVKGGLIRRDGPTGTWSSRSRSGRVYRIDNPFTQAQRSMHALDRKIADTPATRAFTYPFARAVAFPDGLVGDLHLGVDTHQDLIIDSRDLNDLEAAVTRAWDAPRQPGPGPAGVKALVALLAPVVEIQRWGLAASIINERGEMIQLTQQQMQLLDFLAGHRRVAINGVAGSGKSVLAMEQARRLASQGFRVLFTCFNKALAAAVGRELHATLPLAASPIVVKTYHDLATDFARRAGISLPADPDRLPGDEQRTYYESLLPEHLLTATSRLPDRFDAIIVDEGQDFGNDWWLTLEELLADQTAGILSIFYDDNQQIYSRRGDYPIPQPHYHLTKNCRTTRRIHDATMPYATSELWADCQGPAGRDIERVDVVPGQELKALERVIRNLVEVEQVPLEDIVLLSPRGPLKSPFKEGSKAGKWMLSWTSEGPNVIRCRSIHVFKGLEIPVVILAEPQKVYPATRSQLLYVALSRAQHHVIVLGQLPAGQTMPDLMATSVTTERPAPA